MTIFAFLLWFQKRMTDILSKQHSIRYHLLMKRCPSINTRITQNVLFCLFACPVRWKCVSSLIMKFSEKSNNSLFGSNNHKYVDRRASSIESSEFNTEYLWIFGHLWREMTNFIACFRMGVDGSSSMVNLTARIFSSGQLNPDLTISRWSSLFNATQQMSDYLSILFFLKHKTSQLLSNNNKKVNYILTCFDSIHDSLWNKSLIERLDESSGITNFSQVNEDGKKIHIIGLSWFSDYLVYYWQLVPIPNDERTDLPSSLVILSRFGN